MITIFAAALAVTSVPAQPAPIHPAETAALEAPVAAPSAFGKAALDGGVLRSSTAREDISQISSAEQSANVSNNSVNGQSTTGEIRIDGNAFSNMSGLTIVNSNSGNNVAINSAMNVNIVFAPAPVPQQ